MKLRHLNQENIDSKEDQELEANSLPTRRNEIQVKIARVREFLNKKVLKGILMKRQDYFNWITAGGLNVVTVSDIQGISSILITKDEQFVISSNVEKARMGEEERLIDLGFTQLVYDWFTHEENDVLKGIVPLDAIGCDCKLSPFIFIESEIRKLRYSLLPSEIERYLWIGDKASFAIETVLKEYVKPGMKECEIMAELSKMLWNDRIDSVCFQAASDNRAFKYRHGIPTEKRVDKYLILNINARKWGLITTITRSVIFCDDNNKMLNQYRDNSYIECGMIYHTKPGILMKDLFQKTCDLYEEKGYPGEWKHHYQGGAQGYLNREYLMMPDGTDKVLMNQCFCWNPTIAGTKSEDAIITTENGPIFVTTPKLFPILEINYGSTTFKRPDILQR